MMLTLIMEGLFLYLDTLDQDIFCVVTMIFMYTPALGWIAIVEYVRDGCTLKVVLIPSFQHITVALSGIKVRHCNLTAPGRHLCLCIRFQCCLSA